MWIEGIEVGCSSVERGLRGWIGVGGVGIEGIGVDGLEEQMDWCVRGKR